MTAVSRRSVLRGAAAFAVVHWPRAAGAQTKRLPVVGWLHNRSSDSGARALSAFEQGLAELGLKAGVDVRIETRWADGRTDRLPVLAAELAAMKPAVIVANASQTAVILARAAPGIPIVQATGADPVETGLAASLARPGGMVTGITNLTTELVAKVLEVLRAAVPHTERVGYLVDGNLGDKSMASQLAAARRSAAAYGIDAHFAHARGSEDIEPAVRVLAGRGIQALIVMPSPFFVGERRRIIGLAQARRWPVVSTVAVWPMEGALLSYGVNNVPNFRRAAWYVDRILKGAEPGDLPIEQPTKFELVVNLKAAKALGITIPQSILLQADRVIE
jgi:ABC-type uncharacterized transport system substrate-binding protein